MRIKALGSVTGSYSAVGEASASNAACWSVVKPVVRLVSASISSVVDRAIAWVLTTYRRTLPPVNLLTRSANKVGHRRLSVAMAPRCSPGLTQDFLTLANLPQTLRA